MKREKEKVNRKEWGTRLYNNCFPFTGNLWFVFEVSFNLYLWHAQTINFHGMCNKYSNGKEILCSSKLFVRPSYYRMFRFG